MDFTNSWEPGFKQLQESWLIPSKAYMVSQLQSAEKTSPLQETVGASVGAVGKRVGRREGAVGSRVGTWLGDVGALVGWPLGLK